MAKFTNKYIYEPLENSEELKKLEELNRIQPDGYRKDKHHSHAVEIMGSTKSARGLEAPILA